MVFDSETRPQSQPEKKVHNESLLNARRALPVEFSPQRRLPVVYRTLGFYLFYKQVGYRT